MTPKLRSQEIGLQKYREFLGNTSREELKRLGFYGSMVAAESVSMNCPLPNHQIDSALLEPLRNLVCKCRAAKCGFVDSDHDLDYVPSGCILIVCALLATKEEIQDSVTHKKPE